MDSKKGKKEKKEMIYKVIIIATALILIMIIEANAQLNPMSSIYYQNEYLINPALVGEAQRTNFNFSLKKQWANTEGSPSMQAISVDHGISERTGIGISITNEKAGLIQRSKAVASFAYRLPVSYNDDILSVGMGAGIYYEGLDWDKFKGDKSDLSFASFNDRPAYLDADIGVAYENNGFKMQAAIPNVKRALVRDLKRSIVNKSTFYSSISYRYTYDFSEWFDFIEGRVAYRGVEGYKGLFDIGVNINFLGGDLVFNSMYHSSKSITVGGGTIINNTLQLILYYSTGTSTIQNYNNGEFEIGLKYSIFGSKVYESGVNKDRF
nr:PorP/SprF family type IX secretion system membrane protein [uncultured Pedobacter sp.]